MEIVVYRYGHRLARDKRITTHVALTARAFGAAGIVIDTRDPTIEATVREVTERFGGPFSVTSGVSWHKYLSQTTGTVVHLTMYGQPLADVCDDLKKQERLVVVVGAEKVPGAFYGRADYNVAVGNQPHSEVAALAVFLDRVTDGAWQRGLSGGFLTIVPEPRGKNVRPDSRAILRREGCTDDVIRHAELVARIAREIARRISDNGHSVDLQAVETGALLHDVGRARTHSLSHVVAGVDIARKYGLSRQILDIIKHHPGAGIARKEAVPLGLPEDDYLPRTIEEQIVCHADNLADSSCRTFAEVHEAFLRKAGPAAAVRLKELHQRLCALAGTDLDEIVANLRACEGDGTGPSQTDNL
jgi:tRNA (cytidine56-2'-O)-methyltransferase